MQLRLDRPDTLLMSYTLTSDSGINIFLLEYFRQRAKRTLAEQEIDVLQRLPVRLFEKEEDCRNGDQNVPSDEHLGTRSQHNPDFDHVRVNYKIVFP